MNKLEIGQEIETSIVAIKNFSRTFFTIFHLLLLFSFLSLAF
mgnify:CR=1 FL=1